MPPKKVLKQTTLAFAPRAVFPELRNEGAVIMPRPVEAPAGGPVMGSIYAPARKVRRDLPVGTKNEMAKFSKTHSLEQTAEKYTEVSLSTIKRVKKQTEALAKAMHAREGARKRRRPLVKYRALGEKLHNFFVLVRDAPSPDLCWKSSSPVCPRKSNWTR